MNGEVNRVFHTAFTLEQSRGLENLAVHGTPHLLGNIERGKSKKEFWPVVKKHPARLQVSATASPKTSVASFSAALSILISSLFFKFAPPRSEANGEVERGEVLR